MFTFLLFTCDIYMLLHCVVQGPNEVGMQFVEIFKTLSLYIFLLFYYSIVISET